MFTQYQEQGVDYLTALLHGYKDTPPAGVTLPPGSFYNEYFPGHAIAMPPPLTDKRVDYTDGAPMTVEQYAKDVSAFRCGPPSRTSRPGSASACRCSFS